MRIMEFGSARRLPLVPEARIAAPMEAGHAYADGGDVGLDEVHRVDDAKSRVDVTSQGESM